MLDTLLGEMKMIRMLIAVTAICARVALGRYTDRYVRVPLHSRRPAYVGRRRMVSA